MFYIELRMKWTMLFILNLFIIGCYSAYQNTCPQQISSHCSEGNLCTQCLDSLCTYCQDTGEAICDSKDCMKCIDGYKINVLWADQTGNCTIDPSSPIWNPTSYPTTNTPSNNPSIHPTSNNPTNNPSIYPTTNIPTNMPVLSAPNTSNPTYNPTYNPSLSPITFNPTTSIPTWKPTETPSFAPTKDNSQSVVDTTKITEDNTTTTLHDIKANKSSDSMHWAVISISAIIGCVICIVLILILIKRHKASKQSGVNIEQNLKSVVSLSSMESNENQSCKQMNTVINDTNSMEELYGNTGDQDEEMYVNMNDNVTTNGKSTMHGHVNDSIDDMYSISPSNHTQTVTSNETTKGGHNIDQNTAL